VLAIAEQARAEHRRGHEGTNSAQALKLIRPSRAPPRMITVIAAKTNWKYTSDDIGKRSAGISPLSSGMLACWVRSVAPATGWGTPTNVVARPPTCSGWPKLMS
jgi:hypothetical protein